MPCYRNDSYVRRTVDSAYFASAFQACRRFGEINVRVPSISRKVLTEELRELEADGLISTKQFDDFPPQIEYALTEYEEKLCPLLSYIAA
ncbi:winged helix-turn-helix transcriptional regulator [Dyadobacter subterraneus]|uniref:winged helix-turn-helix transcriptional regulator n=1 Tax=Dyadobacter subterraneus TaxID=2773304 RepID=UPI0034D959F1